LPHWASGGPRVRPAENFEYAQGPFRPRSFSRSALDQHARRSFEVSSAAVNWRGRRAVHGSRHLGKTIRPASRLRAPGGIDTRKKSALVACLGESATCSIVRLVVGGPSRTWLAQQIVCPGPIGWSRQNGSSGARLRHWAEKRFLGGIAALGSCLFWRRAPAPCRVIANGPGSARQKQAAFISLRVGGDGERQYSSRSAPVSQRAEAGLPLGEPANLPRSIGIDGEGRRKFVVKRGRLFGPTTRLVGAGSGGELDCGQHSIQPAVRRELLDRKKKKPSINRAPGLCSAHLAFNDPRRKTVLGRRRMSSIRLLPTNWAVVDTAFRTSGAPNACRWRGTLPRYALQRARIRQPIGRFSKIVFKPMGVADFYVLIQKSARGRLRFRPRYKAVFPAIFPRTRGTGGARLARDPEALRSFAPPRKRSQPARRYRYHVGQRRQPTPSSLFGAAAWPSQKKWGTRRPPLPGVTGLLRQSFGIWGRGGMMAADEMSLRGFPTIRIPYR